MKKLLFLLLCVSNLLFGYNVLDNNNDKTITIYSKGIGHVLEKGKINLLEDNSIIYQNIPSNFISDTLSVEFENIDILTQGYFHNNNNIKTILNNYINKEVFYTFKDNDSKYLIGKLILIENNNCLIEDKNNKVVYNIPTNQIAISKIPSNIISTSFVKWDYNNPKKINSTNYNLNYLVNGLSWRSEYNAVILDKDNVLLKGWFNVRNFSGVDYDNVNLNFVAGDINLNDKKVYKKEMAMVKTSMLSVSNDSSGEIENENNLGYKVYHIPFKTSLKNEQDMQIKYINEKIKYKMKNIFVEKIYHPYNEKSYETKLNSDQEIILDTQTSLPEGNIRFYNKDVFVGTDYVKNLSTNVNKKFIIGKNFDISLNIKINNDNNYKNSLFKNSSCKNLNVSVKSYEIINDSNKNEKIEIVLLNSDNSEIKILDKDSSFKVVDDSTNTLQKFKLVGEIKNNVKEIIKIEHKRCLVYQ